MAQEAGVLFRKHRVLADVSSAKHAWKNSVGGAEKQLFDIIFSFALLIILSPIFILTAVAVKLCDNGPLFFSHTEDWPFVAYFSLPEIPNDGCRRG